MLPILVSVFAALPVFKPPDSFEPEWLVPADPKFTGGANYVILNLVNGKRYEGETVNFKNRHYNHMRNMKNENARDHKKHLYCSMRKYGIENFRFYFRRKFVFVGREKLNEIEREAFYAKFKAAYLHPCETYWIRRLNLIKDGYNLKESGEGGGGNVWTDKQKAKQSASMMGNTNGNKPVTRCKILKDGKTHQKVRLTRYESVRAADAATPGACEQHISKCCLGKVKSTAAYLWWFCKDTDVYDEDITVPRVGYMPGTSHFKAVISKLKLANGFLEQWHVGMGEAARTLSTFDKIIYKTAISACCLGKLKTHGGYTFRRVTTEKIEDFDKDGKRIIKSKKRKRLSPI
tara:strand:+ start:9044 stop:10084 length:1041 start_codon:yes stop_codon:yes gene_type:complete